MTEFEPVQVSFQQDGKAVLCPLCEKSGEVAVELHLSAAEALTSDKYGEKHAKSLLWCNMCEALLELRVDEHDRGYGVEVSMWHVGFKHVSRVKKEMPDIPAAG